MMSPFRSKSKMASELFSIKARKRFSLLVIAASGADDVVCLSGKVPPQT